MASAQDQGLDGNTPAISEVLQTVTLPHELGGVLLAHPSVGAFLPQGVQAMMRARRARR